MNNIFNKVCLFFVIVFNVIFANPFLIDFPAKKDLTYLDYHKIQKKLRQLDIEPIINALYYKEQDPDPRYEDWNLNKMPFASFCDRTTRGARQVLIDPKNHLFPTKKLEKIGEGGDRCVVCCIPFNGQYKFLIETLVEGLKNINFNGYVLYYKAAWPNPTGVEIQYIGVPYSFKIFAMVEAHQLGFNNVLWVDSACYPLRDITPIFDTIEAKGAMLMWMGCNPSRYIFPETVRLLYKLTGVDVLKSHFIASMAMGIRMDTPEAKEFVKQYYEMVALGTPFLSCFPEEWVFTAIINQKQFSHWIFNYENFLIDYSAPEALSYFHMRMIR